MNINYKDTPFPYFYGSLDKEMYEYANKLWETDEKKKYYNISKNRSNIDITDKKLINYLTKVGAEVKALSDNLGVFEKFYPKLKKKIHCNNLNFTYSENPDTDQGFPLRDWHLDLGNKIITGLWYFKHPKEQDDGGNLVLGNPHTGEEETFHYGTNKVILFPNTPISWHRITARRPSIYPRRFICLEIKTTKVKLHSYQAIKGKDTMKTFDVKNYYE
tara:strand:+ start:641 stop:1291 length:651 start_codon:yes stop_codon:yes gene_type:complete